MNKKMMDILVMRPKGVNIQYFVFHLKLRIAVIGIQISRG